MQEETGPAGLPARPGEGGRAILTLLLLASAINGAFFAAHLYWMFAGRDGLLIGPASPLGGDFVNLWSAARLVLSGDFQSIYPPDAFMAFQRTFLDADIGLRQWAYPPHSLLFVWPFGLLAYLPALLVWSLFGLAMLALGARRFGFGWAETVVLLASPASFACLHYGQTGNAAAGLLLVALSARAGRDLPAIASAAILTVKPQVGFLLPLVWIGQRRWGLIAATALAAMGLLAFSIAVFGVAAWHDYLTLSAPTLSELERHGSGPFMVMIPSLFMALRLGGMDGDVALLVHALFALVIFALLIRRFVQATDQWRRVALVLVATSLMTPYMHMYDLSILAVAGLLLARGQQQRTGNRFYSVAGLVLVAWLAPYLVYVLGLQGMPIMPLLLTLLFLAI